MASFYGLNANTALSFFNSFNNSSSSTSGTSLYSSLGDYSLIKGGTYFKLCKSYYAKENSETSKSTSTNTADTEKNNKNVADSAVSLKESAKKLNDTNFTEDNRSKLISNIKSFVDDYNKMITSSAKSEAKSVASSSSNLTKYTKANENLLNQAGITIGSDNTLSVNETKLKESSISSLKTLFQGSGSFSSQVSSYATSMYTSAMMNSGSYNSSGSISRLNMSSLYNSYI